MPEKKMTCRQCGLEKPECWPCNWYLCSECKKINMWSWLTEEEKAEINLQTDAETKLREAQIKRTYEILDKTNYKKDGDWNYILPSRYI